MKFARVAGKSLSAFRTYNITSFSPNVHVRISPSEMRRNSV